VGAGAALVAAALGYLFLAPAHGETQRAVCTLLVDRTGSSLDARTEASYRALASRVVQGCRERKSTLLVYYFNNQDAKLIPASDAQPFKLFRPPTHRTSIGEADVKKEMASADAAISDIFEAPASTGGHGSDVVTALQQAAQNLQLVAGERSVSNKYLVVITDGYQTGADLGLRGLHARGTSVQAAVAEAKSLGLVPALQGVDVAFAGVNGGIAATHASPELEGYVRSFWTRLVEQGGGGM
jgi:hypothetical protein